MAHTDAQQHGNSTQHPAKPADGAQYPTNNHRKRIIDAADKPVRGLALARLILLVVAGALLADDDAGEQEIGRASCRERV